MSSSYRNNNDIRKALLNESTVQIVRRITRETIQAIYPHYYPNGAVDFFLSHHKDANIRLDIKSGSVYLLFDDEERAIGTVTIKANEICRLFVLPQHQKKGHGRSLMEFAEYAIFSQYDRCTLDASLPAKAIYRKRGYQETEFHVIQTGSGDFLCYDVMQKKMQNE